jgi:hypothetical protein
MVMTIIVILAAVGVTTYQHIQLKARVNDPQRRPSHDAKDD